MENDNHVKFREFWYDYFGLPETLKPRCLTEIYITFVRVDFTLIQEINAIISALPKLFPNLERITVYYEDAYKVGESFRLNCWGAIEEVIKCSNYKICAYLIPLLFEPDTDVEIYVECVENEKYATKPSKRQSKQTIFTNNMIQHAHSIASVYKNIFKEIKRTDTSTLKRNLSLDSNLPFMERVSNIG